MGAVFLPGYGRHKSAETKRACDGTCELVVIEVFPHLVLARSALCALCDLSSGKEHKIIEVLFLFLQ